MSSKRLRGVSGGIMGLQGSSIGSPGRFMISRAFQGIPGGHQRGGGVPEVPVGLRGPSGGQVSV